MSVNNYYYKVKEKKLLPQTFLNIHVHHTIHRVFSMLDSDNNNNIRLERSGAFLVLSSLGYGGAGDRLKLGGRRSRLECSERRFHGTLNEEGKSSVYIIMPDNKS